MPNIGICGYGFVGKAIAAGFAPVAQVSIFDPKYPGVSLEQLAKSDIIFVAVPTPMNKRTGAIDSSIVTGVIEKIHQISVAPIIVVKSTVTPDVLTTLKANHPKLRLVMNPEFLVEKTAIQDFENQDRIVLGGEREDCEQLASLYKIKWPNAEYYIGDLVSASLVKYMNNTYLALKVSFIAEWHRLAEQAGVKDVSWLIEAFLGDKRVGRSHTHQPGPDGLRGFGGKCFPKDLNALIAYAQAMGCEMNTLEAAWKTNLQVRSVKDWEQIEGATSP